MSPAKTAKVSPSSVGSDSLGSITLTFSMQGNVAYAYSTAL